MQELEIREFTFITLTYNHEKYIIEHLNSIKKLIDLYGNYIKCDYILADDCSSDATVRTVKEWILNNPIFRNVEIISNKYNIGTVRNLKNSISVCKTQQYKFLAGDDKYAEKNIFELYNNIDGSIIITFPKIFGYEKKYIDNNIKYNFNLLKYFNKRKKLYKLLEYDNFIPAPSAFLDGNLLRDNELWNVLFKYKYIEDYPMWNYLICQKRINTKVIDDQYIFYRIGSGITDNNNLKNSVFSQELILMREEFNLKLYKGNRYLNINRYYIKVCRIFASVYVNLI